MKESEQLDLMVGFVRMANLAMGNMGTFTQEGDFPSCTKYFSHRLWNLDHGPIYTIWLDALWEIGSDLGPDWLAFALSLPIHETLKKSAASVSVATGAESLSYEIGILTDFLKELRPTRGQK